MDISQDNWHKRCKTVSKSSPITRSGAMSWGTLLPVIGLAPPYTQGLNAGEQQEVQSLEAGHGQLLLGLGVLYVQNKDY